MPRGRKRVVDEEEDETEQEVAAAKRRREKGKQAGSQGRAPPVPVREEPESDDSEYNGEDGTQRQGGAGEAREVVQSKSNEIVRLAICSTSSRGVVNRTDIRECFGVEQRPYIGQAVSLARKKLRDVFGMDLVEIRDRKGAKPDETARQQPNDEEREEDRVLSGAGKQFSLCNILKSEIRDEFVDWKHESAQRLLLLVVLSVVYFNQDSAEEGALWHGLGKLGLVKGQKHSEFGEVDKRLSDIVRQRYLERVKAQNAGDRSWLYRWGPRAYSEFTKVEIVQFIGTVLEKSEEERARLVAAMEPDTVQRESSPESDD